MKIEQAAILSLLKPDELPVCIDKLRCPLVKIMYLAGERPGCEVSLHAHYNIGTGLSNPVITAFPLSQENQNKTNELESTLNSLALADEIVLRQAAEDYRSNIPKEDCPRFGDLLQD